MSYFGTAGPPQDGGFIGGIARGQARLHNAKTTRARYGKTLGSKVAKGFKNEFLVVPGMSDFPDDEILYKRTKNFTDFYEHANETRRALEDGRISQELADPVLRQYENDKKLIAEWAESGPYVHETKAFALGVAPVLFGVAAYYAYTRFILRPAPSPKASKNAFSAVFS